jgi:hypothetical protein
VVYYRGRRLDASLPRLHRRGLEFGHREEIPKGFRPKAQGCEERATLGKWKPDVTTPTGLRPNLKEFYATIAVGRLCSPRLLHQRSNLEQVKEYIARQDEHHLKMTFQDELRILLRKHQAEWDERYVWD